MSVNPGGDGGDISPPDFGKGGMVNAFIPPGNERSSGTSYLNYLKGTKQYLERNSIKILLTFDRVLDQTLLKIESIYRRYVRVLLNSGRQ